MQPLIPSDTRIAYQAIGNNDAGHCLSPLVDFSSLENHRQRILPHAEKAGTIRLDFELYTLTIKKSNIKEQATIEFIKQAISIDEDKVLKFNGDNVLINADIKEKPDSESETIDTVYDVLGCAQYHVGYDILAVVVCIVQLILLVSIILHIGSTKDFVSIHTNSPMSLIVARLFICFHLSIKIADSPSNSTTIMLSEFLPEARKKVRYYYGDHSYWVGILAGTVYVPIRVICAPCSFFCNKDILLPRSTILLFFETSVICTTVLATVIVTKTLDDAVDSIFNFVGLLLVFEFDDCVAKMLPFTYSAVTFPKEFIKPRNFHGERIIIAFWVFVFAFINLFMW